MKSQEKIHQIEGDYFFTEAELLKLGEEQAANHFLIGECEEKVKEAKANLNYHKAKTQTFAVKIRDKKETREFDCRVEFGNGKAKYIRLSDGVIMKERNMTTDEMQSELPLS